MTERFPEQLAKAIEAARPELARKKLRAIQTETAIKWLGRAVVARELGREDEAHEYAHEALEHAALSDRGSLIDDVRRSLRQIGIKP
jgi:hypothetical protein